jgi:tryptophanyl-tRNA synthetase
MEPVLAPIRERRQGFAEKPDLIVDVLKEGSSRARTFAQQTMERVRRVMTLTP